MRTFYNFIRWYKCWNTANDEAQNTPPAVCPAFSNDNLDNNNSQNLLEQFRDCHDSDSKSAIGVH